MPAPAPAAGPDPAHDPALSTDPAAAYAAFFEQLGPGDLDRLADWFTADARFQDPFNDVRGPAAIRRVFEHMFRTCQEPAFQVLEQEGSGSVVYLRWLFTFVAGGRERCIEGVSRVQFTDHGRVSEHRDYWDPVAGIYRDLPLLGPVLRWVTGRLSAG